jgi:hypothetical protein
MSEKHCLYCKEIFTPHPRKGNKQETCGKPECRKKRKREADRKWRKANPQWSQRQCGKMRAWAKQYPDYWKQYRDNNPEYVEENRRQSKERMRARRQVFAKQDVIWLQLEGVLAFLITQECLQNQHV